MFSMYMYLFHLISYHCVVSMFWEIGYYPNISDESCGLRYAPQKVPINYPIKCFANAVNNQTADDVYGDADRTNSGQAVNISGINLKDWGFDAELGESPFIVNIKYSNVSLSVGSECTGVIINKRWIMTAAHCNYNETTAGNLYTHIHVYVGSIWKGHGDTYRVDESNIYRHRQFKSSQINPYDIAVYQLDRDMEFNILYQYKESPYMANTICLPKQKLFIDRNGVEVNPHLLDSETPATMYGWGQVKHYALTDVRYDYMDRLHRAEITLEWDLNKCRWFLCAEVTYRPLYSACFVDSGAPLVQYTHIDRTRAVLIGITNRFICAKNVQILVWTPVSVYIDHMISIIEAVDNGKPVP